MTGDLQKQPDGTYVAGVYDQSRPIINGLPGSPTIYNQYDNLGNLIRSWSSPIGTISDPDVDGGVTVIATDEHELRLVDDGGAALFFGVAPIYPFDTSAIVDGGACWPDGGAYVTPNTPANGVCGQYDPMAVPGVCSCAATNFSFELEKVAQDGGILWDWNAATHIPPSDINPGELNETALVDAQTVDGYHANSIDIMTDGNYLLSFRDMSTIVAIDSTDGHVMWKLGGVASDFTFIDPVVPGAGEPPGPSFQHFVRQMPNPESDGGLLIYMFDDGNTHKNPVSRGVEYELDFTNHTATMVWEQTGIPKIFGFALGSTEFLPNGDSLICFGARLPALTPAPPHVQEFAPDGGLVWDLSDNIAQPLADGGMRTYVDGGPYPRDFGFYRAFRLDTVY